METTFLVIFYLSIAYAAIRQIKHNPAMTVNVIWINILGILVCIAACSGGIFLLIHFGGGQPISELRAFSLLAALIFWFIGVITVTAIVLKKYNKKNISS